MEEILNYIFGDSKNNVSSLFDKQVEDFLKSATIKVTHNGKPLVDIENGVDKLNIQENKKKEEHEEGTLSEDVRYCDNVYFLNKKNYEGEHPEWKLPFATNEFSGITENELITVLMHRFKKQPYKYALLERILNC